MDKTMTMENGVCVFDNPDFGNVRVIMENGHPLLCGPDVAKALGYANPRDALTKHCKGVVKRDTLTKGGNQAISYITEGDLYRLIAHSNLPSAERFESWIFDEVLPSVRKTGGYVANEDVFLKTYLPFADESTKALFRATLVTINDQNRKIAQQQEKIALDAPKVHFANSVESSQSSILIGTMAKLLKQNGVDTGEKRLFRQLREDGFLCDKGKRHNVPTQKAMELGLFDMTERTFSAPSGEIKISVTTKVTGKGQTYFLNRYAGRAVAAQ